MADDEQDEPTPEESGTVDPGPDEPAEDAPERVTPEVVSATDTDPAAAPSPNDRVPLYRMVRIGFTLLMTIGALTAVFGISTLANPDSVVCASARSNISDELDEDEPSAAVTGIDPDVVDDMDCDEAVPLAEQLDEAGEGELISEGFARNLGLGVSALGLAMIAGGVYALVVRTRRSRTVALTIAGLGLLASFAGLGLAFVSLLMLAFVVYAIGFSRDAKAAYGAVQMGRTGGGGSLFRPRIPPRTPPPSE
jgi:hypothetical protein